MQSCAMLKFCCRKLLSHSWMRVYSASSKEEWESETVTRFTSKKLEGGFCWGHNMTLYFSARQWVTIFKFILKWYVVFQTRDCQALVNITKDMEQHKSTYIHFRGGVNMGIGSFNLVSEIDSHTTGLIKKKYSCQIVEPCSMYVLYFLNKSLHLKHVSSLCLHFYLLFCYQMLSLLPSRVLRLMEWLGFSGDRVGAMSPHAKMKPMSFFFLQ